MQTIKTFNIYFLILNQSVVDSVMVTVCKGHVLLKVYPGKFLMTFTVKCSIMGKSGIAAMNQDYT